MQHVRVAADHWNFERVGTGKFITPVGANVLNDQHPATGTLFDRFDREDCDRRLGGMAAIGFYNIHLHELFDFITFHPYPCWQCLPGGRGDPLDGGEALQYWLHACIGMARLDHYQKPVVVQEFGWYGGGASRFLCELPPRREEEHAAYMEALITALRPHVNGFINWPLADMPQSTDISNHGGIFTHDGRRKALAGVFERLAREGAGARQRRAPATSLLRYALAGVYTSRAYQDRMWDEIDAALAAGAIPDIRFVA